MPRPRPVPLEKRPPLELARKHGLRPALALVRRDTGGHRRELGLAARHILPKRPRVVSRREGPVAQDTLPAVAEPPSRVVARPRRQVETETVPPVAPTRPLLVVGQAAEARRRVLMLGPAVGRVGGRVAMQEVYDDKGLVVAAVRKQHGRP